MSKDQSNQRQATSSAPCLGQGTPIDRRGFVGCAGAAAASLAAAGPIVVCAQDAQVELPAIVTLGDAHKGTLEIDLRIMNQYARQPQKVQDFYTACRAAMTGANPDTALVEVCQAYQYSKLGGPMLGDITSTNVAVWMHLPEPRRVHVSVTEKLDGASKIFKSTEAERFHSVRCEGLVPDTRYVYTASDSTGQELGSGEFTTAPAALSDKPFQIAFGTCFHKVGLHRPELLRLVRERGNRAMLILGDSAVDDRRNDFGLINADYLLRNLSVPWQQLAANVPVFTAWDDHDYWDNDTSGARSNSKKPIDVDGLRRIWRTQWNNPDRGQDRNGIYFQTKIGPVQFIALDTRSCRVNERRGKRNCYLGEEQMGWLKQQISESKSPFVLISSGTMWSDYISDGKDSWGTWDTEGREEIFQAIDAKIGSQVILLSGDRHGARGFAIPRPGGKKIYEFEIATLGGVPGPEPFGKDKSAQLFGLPSRSWAFSEFVFQIVKGVPQVTFHLVNQDGELLQDMVLDS
ncbi:MAG: alkaline phosphatase D family protein [Pirellulaceae bacterium]